MDKAINYHGPLTRDDREKIDAGGRRVLERTGIALSGIDETCYRALKSAGITFGDARQRLFFDPVCLDELLASAPKRFTQIGRAHV
jgi:trimethylamine:corrinoid methyltransferase-like protein